MDACKFSSPVSVRLVPPKGEPRIEHIADVRAGLTALSLGLGDFKTDTPEWHVAFDKLARAKLEPSRERVEDARQALAHLARQSRALVVSN